MLRIRISNLWLIFLFLFILCIDSKAQSANFEKVKLINNFLNSLVDENISSKQIAEDYLFIEMNSQDSLQFKLEALTKLIELARDDKTAYKNDWKIINTKVFKLRKKNRHIFNYSKCKKLSKINLNISENEISNTYVLLDKNKDEIIQYFWLKDGKIYSFNLFIQGNEAWFLKY